MKNSKQELTATAADGTVFSRTTATEYRFVVVHRATQGWAALAEQRLAAAVEFRAGLDDRKVAQAAQIREHLLAEIRTLEAQGKPTTKRRALVQDTFKWGNADNAIADARASVEKAREEVGTVIDMRWTTRRDLAAKHAEKHAGYAVAETLEVTK